MKSDIPTIIRREIKTAEPDAGNLTEQFTVAPTEEQIRDRAYQLYVERGHHHGHDLDDWFEALQDLQSSAPGK